MPHISGSELVGPKPEAFVVTEMADRQSWHEILDWRAT